MAVERVMTECRLPWVDSVKGILILLIVIDHVIGGAVESGMLVEGVWNVLRRLTHSFHVASFFVLVGLLWKDFSVDTHNRLAILVDYAKKKYYRLMVPYFVFGMISVFLYNLLVTKELDTLVLRLLSLVHGGGYGGAFRANSVLWFLPVMFIVLVLYKLIDLQLEWKRFWWGHMIFACVSLLIHRWLVYHIDISYIPMGGGLALKFLAYVILARAGRRLMTCCGGSGGRLIWALLFCALLAGNNRLWLEHLIGDLPSWFVALVLTVLLSFAFMNIVRCIDCKFWQLFGRCSIGVMLLHKFLVVFLEKYVLVRSNIWGEAYGILAVSFVFVVASGVSLALSVMILKTCPVALGEYAKDPCRK